MAQIIELQSFRRTRPPRETVVGGEAEILFFLGVRYESTNGTAPVEPGRPTGSSGRGRKTRA